MPDTEMKAGVLLVDDEEDFLLTAGITLREAQIEPVWTMSDSRRVLDFLEENSNLVVVLDLTMPHLTGRELLPMITEHYPHVPVMVLTAIDEVNVAVECMRSGARDYLVKPIEESRFVGAIRSALELLSLRQEITSIKRSFLGQPTGKRDAFSDIVTNSPSMEAIFRYITAVAGSQHTLLISGETGVGKELIARAAHDVSGRQGEFVAVNAAGLDDNTFTDTLFGHEKGAYTDASTARAGLVARAAEGTLFLDEIGDLAEASQIKLLRLLQERQYYPLGSDLPRPSTARVVVATNQDLKAATAAGSFRNDLYFRIRTHSVDIPPLRERLEDIPSLLDHFMGEAAANLGIDAPGYSSGLVTLMASYDWPGNIRELEGLVHDALARHSGGILSLETFQEAMGLEPDTPANTEAGQVTTNSADAAAWLHATDSLPTFRQVEDELIREAMHRTGGNRSAAAAMLGITRQTLSNRLAKIDK
jgi:DNA-binding NtrC family response regulator